ncbi:MAG: hypothetical protein ACJ8AG_13855 [Ktedonobacteraceae bacterium]
MDEQMALYTAARRYCMERAPGLNPYYSEQAYRDRRIMQDPELGMAWAKGRGTPVQLELFGEILFQMERFMPEAFSSPEALRARLIDIVRGARRVSEDPDEEREENQERAFFQTYLEVLSKDALRAIAPLPSRRVLQEREVARIWQRIEPRWGITANMHWYPLHDVALPPHVVALQEEWFAYALPPDVVREVLLQNGIQRVWELVEDNYPNQYEIDVAFLVPWSSGLEHCWISEEMDWLIYTSHEHSITLCGEWLLKSEERMWPEWKEHIYTSYRYALPPYDGP